MATLIGWDRKQGLISYVGSNLPFPPFKREVQSVPYQTRRFTILLPLFIFTFMAFRRKSKDARNPTKTTGWPYKIKRTQNHGHTGISFNI